MTQVHGVGVGERVDILPDHAAEDEQVALIKVAYDYTSCIEEQISVVIRHDVGIHGEKERLHPVMGFHLCVILVVADDRVMH